MAITLPHIEDLNTTIYLPPKGDYETFHDENHYAEMVRAWGLSSTKEVKKQFWYKEKDHQRLVTITGYEVYGDSSEYYTVIIEFQDEELSCINPAYLKEMQAASFGKASLSDNSLPSIPPIKEATQSEKLTEKKETASLKVSIEKKEKKVKKEKPPKLELPEDKVHFSGTVKQFALSWNNFNEDNDEVVVLDNVMVHQETPLEIGLAWCAHSKTLKKFELAPGDSLEFDGKIVKKKLPKGKDVEDDSFILDEPVMYKVNNPSKIKKS